jgi:acyl phosphate:glycerol-3-phosphate acyltransferase
MDCLYFDCVPAGVDSIWISAGEDFSQGRYPEAGERKYRRDERGAFGRKGLGLATLLLDLGKAFAGVMVAKHLAPGLYDIAVAAAVAAILGHVFPVWLGFRGGKGVASALGVFLALVWPAGLATFAVFVVVFALSRYVSLASVVAAALFPLFGFYFVRPWTPMVVFGFVFIPALIIVKHHGNIRRLLSGTESRFGSKTAPAKSSDSAAERGKAEA